MKVRPQVICRQLGDGGVLVHLDTNQIYELNATGYRVWELLSAGLDRSAIRARLLTEFDVPADRLDGDLAEIFDGLISAHLLEA